MENIIINTYVIKSAKYAIFIGIYVLIIVLLTVCLAISTHSDIVICIGMFLMIAPGIFSSFFRKGFTQEAILSFTDESLTVSIENENDICILYSEMLSFKIIDSLKDFSSFLRINFRDNNFVKFTFVKQRKKYLKVLVVDAMLDFINAYNHRQKEEAQKIILIPSRSGVAHRLKD